MDQETLSLLDFPRILDIIEGFAQSSLGTSFIRDLTPQTRPEDIQKRLTKLAEYLRYYEESGRIGFRQIEDPRPILQKAGRSGHIIEPEGLLILVAVMKLAQEVKEKLAKDPYVALAQSLESLPVLENLAGEVEQCIDPTGEVRDQADPELRAVRRRQVTAREKVQEHLRKYFTGSRTKFLIDQPYVTVRNGRYVIPVRSEHERDVPGVVHGSSSSGATVFAEPFDVIPLNNECLHHEEREQQIIRRVLKRLSRRIQEHDQALESVVDVLAEVDAFFACAEFARSYRCVIPSINREGILFLHQARHPVLAERLGKAHVVPMSVQLGDDADVLMISGPNAGGKTVALKTIGLLSLMTQTGLPVPAAEADLPVFSQILADIGDAQSLSHQLSTFSGHVLRMKRMVDLLGPPSLILLDELGTGTDPVYGAVLGISVVEFFRSQGCKVVATTHHQAIKAFAGSTEGVENASVRLDSQTLRPTYELQFGTAGESSALEIAEQLGLPKAILTRARTLLTETDLQAEQYLKELREELKALEQKQRQLDDEIRAVVEEEKRLQARFQRLNRERQQTLDETIEKLSDEFKHESKRFIKSIRDRFEAARVRKEARRKEAALKEAFRRKMKREADSSQTEASDVASGEWVYHPFFRKQGKVIEIKDGEAVVEIEGKRVASPVSELQKGKSQERPKLPENVTLNVSEAVTRELNLIGCTADEALRRADKFLDRAFLSGLQDVRIVHGFGTGTLRRALSDFLSGHPHVKAHRVEGGATVVELLS